MYFSSARPAMTMPRAASLGIGSMIGAGIFALLGEIGAIAGGSVWLAFVIAGLVALLNGYSLGRLGATFPSPAGSAEFLHRGYSGAFSDALSVLYYLAFVVGMALMLDAFASYAALLLGIDNPSPGVSGSLAAAGLILLVAINVAGSATLGKVELAIVVFKLAALALLIVGGAFGVDEDFLADEFSISSWAVGLAAAPVAFLAYLGFETVTNAGGDLANPQRDIPRATMWAIGIVAVVYVGIALVTFGSLEVSEVIADKETALAQAAAPVFGQAGVTVMALAAIVAILSGVNALLFGGSNISYLLARDGALPEAFDRTLWHGAREGLFLTAGLVLVLAAFLNLSQIAAASALISLVVYMAVTTAHLRLRNQTHAKSWLLWLTLIATGAMLATFVVYLASNQPAVLTLVPVALLAVTLILKRLKSGRRRVRS